MHRGGPVRTALERQALRPASGPRPLDERTVTVRCRDRGGGGNDDEDADDVAPDCATHRIEPFTPIVGWLNSLVHHGRCHIELHVWSDRGPDQGDCEDQE